VHAAQGFPALPPQGANRKSTPDFAGWGALFCRFSDRVDGATFACVWPYNALLTALGITPANLSGTRSPAGEAVFVFGAG
jgi:hypothetical protein